ncbi:MAG: tetratricopeptide repeat protein [Deltaproteobacteria bacterium]|nr:tetratricopeptide repeat protein [Deltaproteobacteria bacterium]
MKERKHIILAAAFLVAVLTLIVYLPSLQNGFVNWDDPGYVYKNANIRSLNLYWVFTAEVVGNWHPLTLLSFVLDYAVWGLNPKGYHLTNSVLHAVNTFLSVILAFSLCASAKKTKEGLYRSWPVFAAIITGLLLGLHPMHVESVAWISERKDVLSALFFMLSIISYLGYTEGGGFKSYTASLISFALALMSKPMAVSLPIVLLIIDYFPLERFLSRGENNPGIKRILLEKAPFFILSLLSAFLALWAQKQSGALSSLESIPLSGRIAVAMRAFIFYIYKLLVPSSLVPFYPRPAEAGLFNSVFIISAVLFAAISIAAVITFKRKKIFIAAWLYYVITLIPVIGIVQVGAQAAADRYTYLPALSLFLLVGSGAGYAFSRFDKKARTMLVLAAIAYGALMSFLTYNQIKIWKDSIALWSHEISIYPDDAPVAYTNRGIALGQSNRIDEALADFSSAIKIKPNMIEAYYNRALAFSVIGRYNEAIEDLTAAIRLKPDYADAYHNRAVAYGNLADYPRAIEDFRRALELNPRFKEAYLNLALAYEKAGYKDEALLYFKKASELGVKEADYYLGNLGHE